MSKRVSARVICSPTCQAHDAALKILAELDASATVLFASDNSLGDDGARILFEGLRERRLKRKRDALVSGDTAALGLVDIHLAGNAMTDKGVLHALRYASEDHVLEKLDFRSQDINVGAALGCVCSQPAVHGR